MQMGSHRYKGDKMSKRNMIRSIFFLFAVVLIFCATILICFFAKLHEVGHILTDGNGLIHDLHEDSSIVALEEKIMQINNKEDIKNKNAFNKTNNYSLVIVIQVHRKVKYLGYLISSLQASNNIQEVLLIFSYDYYDEEINELVNSIRFCNVLQIFYPHPLQMYPKIFPGVSPNDCSPRMRKNEGLTTNCTNAHFADVYGKYRDPRLSEMKHHWWWKANRVFDLAALKDYNGLVLFLEDNNYVLKDFIHALKHLERLAKYSCQTCKLVSLSNDQKTNLPVQQQVNNHKVSLTNQLSNLGMAFNRKVWMEIAKCKYSFCFHEDYNFDLSLKNVFQKCIKEYQFLVLESSRVFRFETCSNRYSIKTCKKNVSSIDEFTNDLQETSRYWFSNQLHLISKHYNLSSKSFGRWSDPRDHVFCLGMTLK